MLDEKIARLKQLVEQREAIDAELSQLLGVAEKPKRGRPPKEKSDAPVGTPLFESAASPDA